MQNTIINIDKLEKVSEQIERLSSICDMVIEYIAVNELPSKLSVNLPPALQALHDGLIWLDNHCTPDLLYAE